MTPDDPAPPTRSDDHLINRSFGLGYGLLIILLIGALVLGGLLL